jgi:DNA-binding transcriptional MerR regulator
MFRIGEFSRLGRVSVKVLRHYDELGLLEPERVDPETDYRYYTSAQLPRLHRIVALRHLGFTLDQIRRLLADDLPAAQIRGMLTLRRAEIEQRLRAEQGRLAGVEERLRQIERDDRLPPYEVAVRSLAPQTVAAIRVSRSGAATEVEPLFEEIEEYVARHQARAAAPPLLLRHGTGRRLGGADLEVAVPVVRPVPANDRVSAYELAGAEAAACVMHTGSYADLDRAVAALHGELIALGYRPAGPLRAVYFRFGADCVGYELPASYLTREPSAFVTELQVPVTHAS